MINQILSQLMGAGQWTGGNLGAHEPGYGYAMPQGGGSGRQQQQFMGSEGAGRISPYGGGGGQQGMDIGGMRGAPSKQGPGNYAYYGMGAIPTAWNNEVVQPKNYQYTGTPDLAKMIRNPWDPTRWDPERDFTPGGGAAGNAVRGRNMSRRQGRAADLINWARGY